MPEAEVQTLAQMRARRDEVEGILRENGWKIARQAARFFQWNRRDSEPLWTPVGEPRLDVAEEWASLLDQAAAIAVKPIDPVPSPAPQDAGGVGATPSAEAVEAPHDAARDWADLSGRWGQQHSAPLPEGLAGLGARGQEPLAPGPTLAEVQAERAEAKAEIDRLTAALDCERVRANEEAAEAARARGIVQSLSETITAITALLDADPERSPAWDGKDQPIPLVRRVEVALMPSESQQVADLRASFRGIERQLGEVDAALHALGSYGLTSTKERLMQVLPPEDRRALLELDAAELRASLARLKARRLNPPPAERVAEYQRKLDIVEAKLCSLACDHSPDAGNMVQE